QYGRSNKKYLKAAQNVAKGLVNMIDENGETTHVLNYPDLTVKDSFRVIYYEGQAALALLKVYQLDQKEEWLNVAKLL
ncbi:poly(glycerol-phosphate) alpha-glucosyltransferase, partial [Staphylococcus aureus]|nr:poly(glycerol-phosphate) alpha-glucosyltransferase [Staphylococcus aureus]